MKRLQIINIIRRYTITLAVFFRNFKGNLSKRGTKNKKSRKIPAFKSITTALRLIISSGELSFWA